jgi:hypothetical protein
MKVFIRNVKRNRDREEIRNWKGPRWCPGAYEAHLRLTIKLYHLWILLTSPKAHKDTY